MAVDFTNIEDLEKAKDLPVVRLDGSRAFWPPDLVRGVRRVAERDEVICFLLPGKPGSSSGEAYLSAAVDMIITEASRLGVKVEHR